jgi:hypothetical protein
MRAHYNTCDKPNCCLRLIAQRLWGVKYPELPNNVNLTEKKGKAQLLEEESLSQTCFSINPKERELKDARY